MAERKVTVSYEGKMVEGIEVPVDESSEKWSEFKLADGTVLRTKVSLATCVRVPGEYDQAGNPTYVLTAMPQMIIIEADPQLKKKD